MDHDDSLNVLLVNDYCNVEGGAEELLHFEAELLESAGHDVTSVGFRRQGEDRAVDTDHVLTESSNRVRRITEKVLIQPDIYRGLRRLLESIDPDIVHIHKNVNYPATVLLAVREWPVIKTHHDFTNVCPSGWAAYQDTHEICPGGPGGKCLRHGCKSLPEMAAYHAPRHAVRLPLQKRLVDRHVAPSRALSGYLRRFGLPTQTIPNPRSKKFGDEPSFGPGDEYFVYFGTHAEKKGVGNLVTAVERARDDRGRTIRIQIAGEGPLSKQLQQRSIQSGLDEHIGFRGFVPDHRLHELVADARAVVVPSIWMENFPTVVSEAFSLGRPVIGSDRGGIPEMLGDGERGILYEATDVDALVDALLELLDEPDRATLLGRAGHQYATHELDPDRYRKRIVRIMREIVEKGA